VPVNDPRFSGTIRPVWAEVDLGAVRRNVAALVAAVAPASVVAVVKADGYGHGAVHVSIAALEGGANRLAVALVEEAAELRQAGIAAPVLLLSEPPPACAAAVVELRLTPVVYTAPGIEALAKAVAQAHRSAPLPVHLKVDTGMHRVGCAPGEAVELARLVAQADELRLEGLCTHLAVADEPDRPDTDLQLAAFERVRAQLAAEDLCPPLLHAANSAAAITRPDARFDLVRTGIAIYGIRPFPPGGAVPTDGPRLEPALSLKARVSYVRQLPAGSRISYGLRYELDRPSWVATVPSGYADGVPRRLGHVGGEVLVRGRRHPIAGTVTMDQLMVDLGDEPVEVGEEVVLLGRQGDQVIGADDWAGRLDTIAYEIVTGLGPRVPRRYER
jgi:alanine racemase